MILGDILKEYRSKNKLSMDKFAELSGLTKVIFLCWKRTSIPKLKSSPANDGYARKSR